MRQASSWSAKGGSRPPTPASASPCIRRFCRSCPPARAAGLGVPHALRPLACRRWLTADVQFGWCVVILDIHFERAAGLLGATETPAQREVLSQRVPF